MATAEQPPTDPVAKLRELIDGIRIAMLTTTDAEGVLHSRPMATQEVAFDGDLWFITSLNSSVVDQVRAHGAVLVNYVGEHRFVAVRGTAFVLRDRTKVQELWNPGAAAWFPDGPDSPEIALIRVDVGTAEYWESPSAPVAFLEMVRALATGKQFKGGSHSELTLMP